MTDDEPDATRAERERIDAPLAEAGVVQTGAAIEALSGSIATGGEFGRRVRELRDEW